MTKLEIAQNEIRAIFTNEIECLYESTPFKLQGSRIMVWGRQIRLAGINEAAGRWCESTINYAIYPDGYWEQIGLGTNSEWQS